jgi:hypothetical protein
MNNDHRNFNIYYGVPHSHTSYSDGFDTPTEAYEFARKNKLNFLIITDHAGRLLNSRLNHNESILLSGSSHPKWEMLKIEAAAINKKYNDFLALTGFELSTKFWGHLNILNSKELVNKKIKGFKEVYSWLSKQRNVLVSVNHPYRLNRILRYSAEYDEFINLFEVGHGAPPKKYVRADDYYYRALDEGWHVAAINGQDNHINNWGTPSNVTAVIAENLSENSIMEAMKARRVYSTESRTLRLKVKGNDKWMGSIVNTSEQGTLSIEITAEDKANPITNFQILTNGGNILAEKNFNSSTEASWNFSIDISKPSWYVVKVIQQGEKIGIASAIFAETTKVEP